jgi:hypothetical protein
MLWMLQRLLMLLLLMMMMMMLMLLRVGQVVWVQLLSELCLL